MPGESLASFALGFDRLHALRPHEIQLGILKRLRGTPIARHTAPFQMVFDPAPPYTVLQTGAVDAPTMARFSRLARYWELVANSGRFKRTLALLLNTPVLQAVPQDAAREAAPFNAFLSFSDWLWWSTGKTSGLSPEMLVDALFDYLSARLGLPAATVQETLLADYVASGARANPQALKGLLPRRQPPASAAHRSLATRQEMHLQTPS